jgi:thimet oligopeptidase
MGKTFRIMLPIVATGCIVIALKAYALFINQKESMKNLELDIPALFAKTPQEIEGRMNQAMEKARKSIDDICSIPAHERSWHNTAHAFDRARAYDFVIIANPISVLTYVSTNDAVRTKAQEALVQLEQFATEIFDQNVQLYKAFKEYVEGNAQRESLSITQQLFLKDIMDDFKRNGLDLPEEQRKQVLALNKELAALSVEFEQNINKDQRSITATREELEGLDDDFISALRKTDDGKYIVGTDYPTYFMVLEHCCNAMTRKRLYHEFNNRAYPANQEILKKIIEKRDQLARLLGFESYAHLNLDNEMVKSPERAREFLDSVATKICAKEQQEFEQFCKDLPASVVLYNGKLNPWDRAFLFAYHKKKYYSVDEREIAQYFPMEKTVQGLLDIYKRFFNLSMEESPISGLWDDQLRLIKIGRSGESKTLGYIILDLHPRPHKYTHACEITVLPSFKESSYPACAVVLANFPKSTATKPSLLELNDVRTFFHEFGHAIHELLGVTPIASYAGTKVKHDFVELPSQILEEWLWDPTIIKMMSCHYKTGKKLSDEMIGKIIALKNLSTGFFTTRQLCLAYLALDCYASGAQKDIDQILRENFVRMRKHELFYGDDHMCCSFGHLMGYGARYYGYLWSKVFALDMFNQIKAENGLLDPKVGERYTAAILSKGGSQDPNDMLKEFLGREPNADAFFKDMGI